MSVQKRVRSLTFGKLTTLEDLLAGYINWEKRANHLISQCGHLLWPEKKTKKHEKTNNDDKKIINENARGSIIDY